MRKRRQILVKPFLQLRFGFFIFLLTFFISSALLWSFFYCVFSLLTESISPKNIELLLSLREQLVKIGKWEFTLLFFSCVCIGLVSGIIFSHAVLGPLHRLEKILKEWDGKTPFPKIKFRRNDLLHFLAEAFNQAVKKCEKHPKDE